MWASYERFASSTELHGFDMILRYKNNRFWTAVWICLTAVAVCMCVNDAVNLVVLYKSEPTAVSVSLNRNVNLTLPNPTLCMEIHLDGPMLLEVIQNVKMTHPTFTRLTTEQIQLKIETDLEVFLEVTGNAENLDIQAHDQLGLSGYLEYYTYLMLSYIAEGELKYVGYNNTIAMFYDNDYVAVNKVGHINVNPTIGYLYSAYMNRNVSVANLQRLVGMSICQKRTESLISQKDGVTENLPVCQPRMITHLSFSRVCSKLFEDDTYQMADHDSFELSGTKVTEVIYLFTDLLLPAYSFQTSEIVFTWYLDFHGRALLPQDSRGGIFGWNPTSTTAFELSVAAEYHLYNGKFRSCSETELTSQCDWRQRVEKLQNSCGCRPSSLADGVGDMSLPICGQDNRLWVVRNDTVNTQMVVDATYVGFCSSDIPDFSDIVCPPSCKTMTLTTQSRTPNKIINEGIADTMNPTFVMPSGVVEFSVKTTGNHPYFDELPTKNFSSFICDFGGSIGAWLGASLMAFIHAVIHIILSVRDVANRPKERGGNV